MLRQLQGDIALAHAGLTSLDAMDCGSCCCAAQFVVGLGDRVAPTDIEEGMRVG